ncbi:MAG: hypothetical protein HC908_12530, partial [Calothrix sp. SM1_7_51]|nr:hypothetical protein [Calothrix sp. SM1_7_51]
MNGTKLKKQPPSGEIRQSQIISTFGSGSMTDLPNHSVLISGINHWDGYRNQPIYEERLAARVAELLLIGKVDMYAPPAANQDPTAPRTGIKVFTFPAWFVAQIGDEKWTSQTGKDYQTRPLIPWGRLVKGKYLGEDRKKYPV